VVIDSGGDFSGYAWGENVGWIHFANASPAYKVETDWLPEPTPTPTNTPTQTPTITNTPTDSPTNTPTTTPTNTPTITSTPTMTPSITSTPTVTPTPGVSLPFADDFSDGNMAGWTVFDQGYFFYPSDWKVENGELIQSSLIFDNRPHLPGTFALVGDTSWTDYYMKVRMRSGDTGAIGVMFRYQNAYNYYRFSMNGDDENRRLVKVVSGTATVLAEQPGEGYVTGNNCVVEIRATGNALEVYLNGEKILPATGEVVSDSTFTSGAIGLYCWQNMGAYFDNVLVAAIDQDYDTDGTPDIGDPDDDNDGIGDFIEELLGANPLSMDSVPALLRINFGPDWSQWPEGHAPDSGKGYAPGRGYGWQ